MTFFRLWTTVRRASTPRVGLAKDIRKAGNVLKRFVALCALPLLPSEEIRPMFNELKDETLEASPKVGMVFLKVSQNPN